MLVVLRPEAEVELLEVQAWYESIALGLGFEFARAADAAVASAQSKAIKGVSVNYFAIQWESKGP